MPENVYDESHGRDPVENSANVEAFFPRKNGLEQFHFVEHQRKAGDHQSEKGGEKDAYGKEK